MEETTLTILRGPQSVDAVGELVRLLASQDVVLFELTMPRTHRTAWRQAYMRLSMNADFADTVLREGSADFTSSVWTQVVHGLRGQRKIFDFVESPGRYVPSSVYEDIASNTVLAEAWAEMAQEPAGRYDALGATVDSQAQEILERDKQLAGQIVQMLETNKTYLGEVTKQKGVCRVAVVVGVLHNVQDELRQLVPGVQVNDHLFCRRHINAMLQHPYLYLLHARLQSPKQPLDPKAIDYFACVMGDAAPNDTAAFRVAVATLGPQANYSARELKSRADALLAVRSRAVARV